MTRIPTGRRGVILLVILGMLALFMLIGVSFVVTSTHARSSALATMGVEQSGDSPDRSLSMAMLNVVRGSRSPRSAIGPHSLLEDMYGEHDAVVGVIRYAANNIPAGLSTLAYPPLSKGNSPIFPQYTTSGVVSQMHLASNGELIPVVGISFGPDRMPGLPGVDDNHDNQIDNNDDAIVSSLGQPVSGSDDYYLGDQPPPGFNLSTNPQFGMGADGVMGYYAGRVLTMVDGPLARQSTRIVWFYPVFSSNSLYWVLVLRPFALPSNNNASAVYNVTSALTNHRFVINGRPFNGQGFGYNPLNSTQIPANNWSTTVPSLVGLPPNINNLSHFNLDGNPLEAQLPFALLPNPTDRRYIDYLADRSMYTSTGSPSGTGSSTLYVTPFTTVTATNSPNMTNSSPNSNPYGVDADEDYDAPDYNNLAMAWRVWNPTFGNAGLYGGSTSSNPGGRWQTRSPSFHRPELVNYWMQQCMTNQYTKKLPSTYSLSPGSNWNLLPGGESGNSSVSPRLRQRIILRPDPQDNFDPLTQDTNGNGRWDAAEPFTDSNGNGIWDPGELHQYGSGNSYQPAEPDWSGNVYFNPINGPWDVDNDNDGEPDSVWIDLGAPIQSAADGTQYKALFAVLCLDMDGRLNINAHGNNSHVHYANYANSTPVSTLTSTVNSGSSSTSVSDDSVILGMKQMHSYHTSIPEPPVYKALPTNGPFAGLNQQPNSTAVGYYTGGVANTSLSIVPMGTGLGFSVADINLAPLFGAPSMTYQPMGTSNTYVRWGEYRFLMQGKATTGNSSLVMTSNSLQTMKQPIPGRYGEPHLLNYKMPSASGMIFPGAGVTYGQQSVVPDSYDDNVPAAAQGPLLQAVPSSVNIRGNAMQASLPTAYNTQLYNMGYVTQGLYGSPVDPFGKLAIGLDFRGQPVYANLPHPQINELIDDPWELDLSRKGKRSSYMLTNSTKLAFESDKPFTPGELETMLRVGDSDLATLQSRPVQMFGMLTKDSQMVVNFRNRVTTESWDLPCPNITPTPEIRRGLQMLGLSTTNCSFADLVRGKIAFVQGLSVTGVAPNYLPVPNALALANEQALLLLNGRLVQAGYQHTGSAAITYMWASVLPAFSPDLLMGLRMNLNRAYGNAWDDNQNGAVDDPGELAAVSVALLERMWMVTPGSSVGFLSDPNQDGIGNYGPLPLTASSANSQNTALPAYDRAARSEMAKQLYMLMMLLTDSDWMYWYPTTQPYLPFSPGGGTVPPTLGAYAISPPVNTPMSAGLLYAGYANTINNPPTVGSYTPGSSIGQPIKNANPVYLMNAQQKLAAYRIAQWAVNAVDFSDRDAIMTPFEFDLCPFNIDGYSVDGNVGSYASSWVGTFPSSLSTLPSAALFLEPDRAVVWGMEYPDLLITETAAFHDKAWANTADEKPAGGNPASVQGTLTNKKDPNWDQARLPQGSLFVELYCPGKPNTQIWPTYPNMSANLSLPSTGSANMQYLPAELYDVQTPVTTFGIGTNSFNKNTNPGNANVGTLDLERLTPVIPGSTIYRYPVWRLALANPTATPRPTTGTPPLNPTTVNPAFPSANAALKPNPLQSIQNRFITRSDTTTILPLTVLSTHPTNVAYSQRALAAPNIPAVPAKVAGAAAPSAINLDSYVLTDFIDTTPANLPAHTVFLQRFVYFARPSNATTPYYPPYTTTFPPNTHSTTNPAQAVYQPRPTNLSTTPHYFLHPGSYAVVGPRRSSYSPAKVTTSTYEDVTFVGYNDGTITNWAPQAINLGTYAHPYQLLNPVARLTPVNGNRNDQPMRLGGYPDNQNFMSTKIKNPLGIAVASGPLGSGYPIQTGAIPANTRIDRGLNISEPPQGYLGSTVTQTSTPHTYKSGNSSPFSVTINDTWAKGSLPDIPLDANTAVSTEPWAIQPISGSNTSTMSRTLIDYSTVLLQRLADPTQPWDPTLNPYMTIDWMPVDLTVFNGQNAYNGTPVGMNDTSDPSSVPKIGGNSVATALCFETRQRGPRNTWQTSKSSPGAAPAPFQALTAGAITAAGNAVSYSDVPAGSGYYRWPVTSYYNRPDYYVMPPAYSGGPTAPSTNSNLPMINFNAYSGTTNQNRLRTWHTVTEAPLWCQMSDDPRQTPATVYFTLPGNVAPKPAMGASSASFTSCLYGTLGFLNEGYGLVDFNLGASAAALPSPSAIDAPSTQLPTTAYLMSNQNDYSNVTNNTGADIHQTLHDYVGDPQRPFPWLTWNNRPYANAMELLLVPASQPARLGWEFTYKTSYTDAWTLRPDPMSVPPANIPTNAPQAIPGGALWDSHYALRPNPPWGGWRLPTGNPISPVTTTTVGALTFPPAPATNYLVLGGTPTFGTYQNWPGSGVLATAIVNSPAMAYVMGGYPFGHLLNFFGSSGPQACTNYTAPQLPLSANSNGIPIDPLVGAVGSVGSDWAAPGAASFPMQPASNFHRIFEYVHVPSRFSGTQESMDPVVFSATLTSGTPPLNANPNNAMSRFLVPFNRVSRYREPGKVNLNTISDTWLKSNNFSPQTATYPAPYWFAHQPDIFQGIMNDFPGHQHIWDNLLGGLHVLDARGVDKAWGFARNWNARYQSTYQNPSGDDDGGTNAYAFPQLDDQWEAGWPGWANVSAANASDDWIPATQGNPQGPQMLIAGASNERLLNHLYNFTAAESGSSALYPDLPYGSAFGAVASSASSGGGAVGTPLPTFFANPFRSFCTSYSVPIPQMLYWWPTIPSPSATGVARLNGNANTLTCYPMPFYWADSSLFRRANVHPTRRYEPLFVYNSTNWWTPGDGVGANALNPAWEKPYLTNSNTALFFTQQFRAPYPDAISRTTAHLRTSALQPGEFGESFRDSNRNPYFRYQPLMKLGNNVTTRSNVYAIWVTVGYFEVQRARLDQRNPQATFDRNPEGYRLVRELGSDTGNVRRHRGFAIYDRTLPVGFLRGENLNVNDGFLIRRMIE